jgi:hypothetical protein
MDVPDNIIVSWYISVRVMLLSYYGCCQNFYKIRDYINHMAPSQLYILWRASTKFCVEKLLKNILKI